MIDTLELGYVHGSCVDFDGKGILATGPSGSGKSTLALELIALGGVLLSDDQVYVTTDDTGVLATAPKEIAGKIEARSVGILNCPYVASSYINLIVDLNTKAAARLPDCTNVQIGQYSVTVIAGRHTPNLPIAAKLLNLYGRDPLVGMSR